MIDHQVLKERLQGELDKLDLTEPEKDRLVTELNVLARILIDACRAQNTTGRIGTRKYWYFESCNLHHSVGVSNTSTFRLAGRRHVCPSAITESRKVKMVSSHSDVGVTARLIQSPERDSGSGGRGSGTEVQFREVPGVRLGLKNRTKTLGGLLARSSPPVLSLHRIRFSFSAIVMIRVMFRR